MRGDPDLDQFRPRLAGVHLHFFVYKAQEMLHPVQDGLNLELNS